VFRKVYFQNEALCERCCTALLFTEGKPIKRRRKTGGQSFVDCFSNHELMNVGKLSQMSFVMSFVIAGFNWYGNHILVRSSQHLARK